MHPAPSTHRSTAQGGGTGGTAANARGASRPKPGGRGRPSQRPVGRVGEGGRGGGARVSRANRPGTPRPPPRVVPLLHTLRAPFEIDFVKKCSLPNLSSQRAFFCMAKGHKKPPSGPKRVEGKSHPRRSEGLDRHVAVEGGGGVEARSHLTPVGSLDGEGREGGRSRPGRTESPRPRARSWTVRAPSAGPGAPMATAPGSWSR